MSIVDTGPLKFLVERVRWPVPAIKWWAIQEIAGLLIRVEWRDSTEQELVNALSRSLLETEVVELLYAFTLAKVQGYVPTANLPQYIRAKSPLSTMLLQELYGPTVDLGQPSFPPVVAPKEFSASRSFSEEQGRSVPLIFQSLLRQLSHPSLPPLLKQYGFEWDRTAAMYPDAPLQRSIHHFFRYPYDQMTGQFVTRSSHRGRSAYLRTLAMLEDLFDAPRSLIDDFALAALPLDPTFAALTPHRPGWLPRWDRSTDRIEHGVAQYLTECHSGLKASNSHLLALASPLFVSDELVLEIEAIRWAQWSETEIDADELFDRHERRFPDGLSVDVATTDLRSETRCFTLAASTLLDTDVTAVPLAAPIFPSRPGYLHADLYSRGLYAPVTTAHRGELSLEPENTRVVVKSRGRTVGSIGYWNEGWSATYPRLANAMCGVALLADIDATNDLLGRTPARYFTLWKLTSVRRDTHSEFEKKVTRGIVLDPPHSNQSLRPL